MKRVIFQPNELAQQLISGYSEATGASNSDFINLAICNFMLPVTPELRGIAERIQQLSLSGTTIDEKYLQHCLADAVDSLSSHPVNNYKPLEQIMYHFLDQSSYELYYTYILDIDDHENDLLRRLNFILHDLDPNYSVGKRELAPRMYPIFANWNKLCVYKEIYKDLSILIRRDTVKIPLDLYRTISLLKDLDTAVLSSSAEILSSAYPLGDIPLSTRVTAIQHEINAYVTDNAYVALTGDHDFSQRTEDVKAYYKKMATIYPTPHPLTEEYYFSLVDLEQQGQAAFKHAAFISKHRNEIENFEE